jgi:hypothetical protein
MLGRTLNGMSGFPCADILRCLHRIEPSLIDIRSPEDSRIVPRRGAVAVKLSTEVCELT